MIMANNIKDLKLRIYEDHRKGLIEESVAKLFLEEIDAMEVYIESAKENTTSEEENTSKQKKHCKNKASKKDGSVTTESSMVDVLADIDMINL